MIIQYYKKIPSLFYKIRVFKIIRIDDNFSSVNILDFIVDYFNDRIQRLYVLCI